MGCCEMTVLSVTNSPNTVAILTIATTTFVISPLRHHRHHDHHHHDHHHQTSGRHLHRHRLSHQTMTLPGVVVAMHVSLLLIMSRFYGAVVTISSAILTSGWVAVEVLPVGYGRRRRADVVAAVALTINHLMPTVAGFVLMILVAAAGGCCSASILQTSASSQVLLPLLRALAPQRAEGTWESGTLHTLHASDGTSQHSYRF